MKRQEALKLADKHSKLTAGFLFNAVTVHEMIEEAIAIERKACEALYEHEDVQAPVGNSAWGEAYQDGWIAGAQAYRDAIKARSSHD